VNADVIYFINITSLISSQFKSSSLQ